MKIKGFPLSTWARVIWHTRPTHVPPSGYGYTTEVCGRVYCWCGKLLSGPRR